MAQKYDATLNLPKTEFPMRAGLPKREPEMLKKWEEQDIYNEMLKKNEGKPRFSLHDGPPFSNGNIHMGHALNKSIKDFIVRSYAMRGYYTPYIPGWDNHGMPIESAIIKEQKLNHKAMSVADFRSACEAYAEKYINIQREGFKRMGVIGDWEHPYKTMDPGFEAMETRVFGKMYKNGHIYKGLKPVYWCPSDETALAEAEIEYQDDPCTTVYVKFPMHDDQGKLSAYDKSKRTFKIELRYFAPVHIGAKNPQTRFFERRYRVGEVCHARHLYVLTRAGGGAHRSIVDACRAVFGNDNSVHSRALAYAENTAEIVRVLDSVQNHHKGVLPASFAFGQNILHLAIIEFGRARNEPLMTLAYAFAFQHASVNELYLYPRRARLRNQGVVCSLFHQ